MPRPDDGALLAALPATITELMDRFGVATRLTVRAWLMGLMGRGAVTRIRVSRTDVYVRADDDPAAVRRAYQVRWGLLTGDGHPVCRRCGFTAPFSVPDLTGDFQCPKCRRGRARRTSV